MNQQQLQFDYIIIGSGFGGSVSALRLAEKGYRVAVLERGKRWHSRDFPRTNWNIRKFLWAPLARCFGIQAITFLRDTMILHGVGVGGGSLVYANTLLKPPESVFATEQWRRLGDWSSDLEPHYRRAQQMMGVTTAQCPGETDKMLHQIAVEMDRGESYHPTQVAVYFGQPGEPASDPYFNGRGPERTGCILCGGCMVGCRHGAKNTLDKNYLYLAEQAGVQVYPETKVIDIRETAPGRYEIDTVRQTGLIRKHRQTFCSKGVVLAGGVMGTVPLLMQCKIKGSLARISNQLGRLVRTNSEALVGATSRDRRVDYSKGIAIASGFRPDDDTSIEMCRYGAGQDFMSLLCTLLVPGGPPWPRWLRFVGQIFKHPFTFLRLLNPIGWARRSGILLVMQSLPNHMQLTLRRKWYWPFGRRLSSHWETDDAVPKFIPVANEVAERLAEKMDGDASASAAEAVFNLSSTAHILGGCPMGQTTEEGVINRYGQVFGYENLFIVDGSIIPGNLSVNPSLTILALGEWIMSHVPDKQ